MYDFMAEDQLEIAHGVGAVRKNDTCGAPEQADGLGCRSVRRGDKLEFRFFDPCKLDFTIP